MLKFLKKIFIFAVFLSWVFSVKLADAKWSDYVRIKWSSGSWRSSTDGPEVISGGLPGWRGLSVDFFINFINKFIWWVAVFAVFALIFSWLMYILSGGDDEKAKKAKKWILWTLSWVIISSFSWVIILFLNNISL